MERATLLAPVLARARLPLKVLPVWVIVMVPFVALTLVVPTTLRVVFAAWVMLPLALTTRLPVATLLVPRTSALPLFRVTSKAPALFRATAPVKALAWFSVISPLVALKEAVQPTANVVLAA